MLDAYLYCRATYDVRRLTKYAARQFRRSTVDVLSREQKNRARMTYGPREEHENISFYRGRSG